MDTDRRLPHLLVIGAMKCGTTALHEFLDRHPQIRMSRPKELNFFLGSDRPPARAAWSGGNWWRGVDWYAAQAPDDAGTTVWGESSPGYTSPDHPRVAARIARTVPAVRLVYLVRDPVARALSQYHHHRDDGTETRPARDALLDPSSHYIARGRYHERLAPFLTRIARDQILVITQEDLRDEPVATLRRVFAHVGVDPTFRCDAYTPAPDTGVEPDVLDRELRCRLVAALQDDAATLRDLLGDPLARWSL